MVLGGLGRGSRLLCETSLVSSRPGGLLGAPGPFPSPDAKHPEALDTRSPTPDPLMPLSALLMGYSPAPMPGTDRPGWAGGGLDGGAVRGGRGVSLRGIEAWQGALWS